MERNKGIKINDDNTTTCKYCHKDFPLPTTLERVQLLKSGVLYGYICRSCDKKIVGGGVYGPAGEVNPQTDLMDVLERMRLDFEDNRDKANKRIATDYEISRQLSLYNEETKRQTYAQIINLGDDLLNRFVVVLKTCSDEELREEISKLIDQFKKLIAERKI